MQRCWLVMNQCQYLDAIAYDKIDTFGIHIQTLKSVAFLFIRRSVAYFNQYTF